MPLPEIVRELSSWNNYLITSHIRPDGDAIGSTLGVQYLVEALGKKATIVLADQVPDKYSFLPGSARILTVDQVDNGTKFDAVVMLDIGEYNRAGDVLSLVDKSMKVINIDHHKSNDGFGDASWVDAVAPATAEMLVQAYNELGIIPDVDTALAMYTALMTDTGRFRFSNTNARAFHAAAYLSDWGASADLASESVFYNTTKRDIQTLGHVLGRIELHLDSKLALSYMTHDEQGVDTEGFVDYLTSIQGVEIALIFHEINKEFFKVSLRSTGDADVSIIAAKFGGGGHRKAAGCRMNGLKEDNISRMIEECRTEIP